MIRHNLEQILRRINSYPKWEVLVEMLVIGLLVYVALRFLRGTRGAGVVKGFAVLIIGLTLVIRVLGGWADAFTRLNFIYDKFLGLIAIMLVVVFQPELRRAMMRLGETRLFRPARRTNLPVVGAVCDAAEFLSKNQFGALIAIAREMNLSSIAEAGVRIEALVTSELLRSIFWPNNPLHDLGVIIQGDRVLAAGVQFPLVEEGTELSTDLGSRHRAGIGLSAETDCIVVIVSEETGRISVADGGRIERDIPRNELPGVLILKLRARALPAPSRLLRIPARAARPVVPAATESPSQAA